MAADTEKREMISIEEALAIIKTGIPAPVEQEYAIEEAFGKILAEDIHAPESSPRFTNSAMDGYGVRWEDVHGAEPDMPVTLDIVGESRAGTPFHGTVGKGEAVRISTGAMLATWCDTVIPVEDTEELSDRVRILAAKKQGQHVRCEGEEFREGDLLLPRGTKIAAPQAALLAAVGITRVKAYRQCEVAVLVTGSELVAAGETIAEHQIRDSNMIMLKAAIEESGGRITRCVRVADEEPATIEAIGQTRADIIVCTGGVSVGRHDHVKNGAEANGFAPLFWKIRQKPGKPLYLARKGTTLLFGLPGNPVSAFMCFAHYVRPVITVMNGLPFGWPTVSGEAGEDITNRGSRTNMIRVQLAWLHNGGYCITHVEKQGSHMLTSLSGADGYVIVEPGQTLKKGERADVYRYDFRRDPVEGSMFEVQGLRFKPQSAGLEEETNGVHGSCLHQ
ncbi:MAG: molybdopterin molybdotransferase MoeA [Desulfobulbaceae bacterium]|nr:molybdopterin molybdotransferase MoeA [Desulfobulbaceae bacterium]